jgi:two-component system, cell cycle response regulator DivK
MTERRQRPRPQTVLVADDNPSVRQLWSAWLGLWNFLVLEAHDGAEAVQMARQEHPALIVMDIAMPRLDGLSATRCLKSASDTAEIPVVMLTAYSTGDHRQRALDVGCEAFLTKPCDVDHLLRVIRVLLGRSSTSPDHTDHAS